MSISDHMKVRVKRERDPQTQKSSLCLQPSEPLKWAAGILSGLIVSAIGGAFAFAVAAFGWAHDITAGQRVVVTKIEGVEEAMEKQSTRLDRYEERLREVERGET